MDYQFSVVELPAIQLVGMSIQTNMEKATTDCPALWQSFAPRITGELASCANLSEYGDTYGVSRMTDEHNFIYWAGIGVDSVDSLPEGMATMTIPQSWYVNCTARGIEQLGEALMAIYCQWQNTQDEYVLDMQGISLERYPQNWQCTDALEVYASVLKK